MRPDLHEAEKSVVGVEPSPPVGTTVREQRAAKSPIQTAAGWDKVFPHSQETYIAILSALGILLHFVLRYAVRAQAPATLLPLYATLLIGGAPLVLALVRKLIAREFGSDLLAGVSILSSVLQCGESGIAHQKSGRHELSLGTTRRMLSYTWV
ncbi:MAG: hypothetical protein ACHP8B_13645 [Terriglobales bacterium]